MAAHFDSAPPPQKMSRAKPRDAMLAGRPHLEHRDGLSKAQLRLVIAAIAALHVGGGWAVMQIPAVREAVTEAVPLFVNFVPAPEVPKPETPPPPPPPPRPTPKVPPPPAALVTAPPTPAPAPFVAPPPPPEPVPVPPPPPAPEPAPPPPPAPPAPQNLPIEAIRYAFQVQPEYPATSKRLREEGRVTVRVLIDEKGLPNDVRVEKSSGFSRLDSSAVSAVKRFRFYPAVVNGRPATGYASIPVDFNLTE